MLSKAAPLSFFCLVAVALAQIKTWPPPKSASEEIRPIAQPYLLTLAVKSNTTFNGMKLQADSHGSLVIGKTKSDTQCREEDVPEGKKCSDFSDQLGFYDDYSQDRIAYTNKSGGTQTIFFCSDGMLKLSRPNDAGPFCPTQHTTNSGWLWTPKPKEFGLLPSCNGADGLHICTQPDGLFTFHSDELASVSVPGFYACSDEGDQNRDPKVRPWHVYALTPEFNHYELSRNNGSYNFSRCLMLDGLAARPYVGPPAWSFYGAEGE